MRALLAFDKFKHALSARAACDAAAEALRHAQPCWVIDRCPLTDGGDGFAEILTRAVDGDMRTATVAGPRGQPLQARFGIVPLSSVPTAARAQLALPDSLDPAATLALIELASASGLARLPPDQHDPWRASTLGTGELILAASRTGCAGIVLGLGGSASNDLGAGALAALGLEFLSADGTRLRPPVPAAWAALARIRGSVIAGLPPLRLACDVANPLLGSQGCAAVYGPQKGLAAQDVARLDDADARLARMLCHHCGASDALMDAPGTGAAGGTAFGLMVAAGARLVNGSALVSAWLDLDRRIAAADLVLTGEGAFDHSSLAGKGPGHVVALAQAHGKTVHVFAGRIAGDLTSTAQLHAITPPERSLPAALASTAEHLREAVRQSFS